MYKVFVVEDSPTICEVIIGSLESSGQIEIIGLADSSESALRNKKLTSADAIIIDLALRQGSGFQLLAKLQATPDFVETQKIVLTNYATGIFRQRALALGANYFFDKSLEFDQVLELLQSLSARHTCRAAGPTNASPG
jgi:DNA-binding NarL/FixJ family response regulator